MRGFKYYKRGTGELDTSNFPQIAQDGSVGVDTIDDRTLVSMMALNDWVDKRNISVERGVPGATRIRSIKVVVSGYVAHMRGDKDEYPVAFLYDRMTNLNIHCCGIQHESTAKIRGNMINAQDIMEHFDLTGNPYFIGADTSVPKFCTGIDQCAVKVREDGKVISSNIDILDLPENETIVIVDDILGAGATVQQVIDQVSSIAPRNLLLWVAYNEGIHPKGFIKQFDKVYLGDLI